MLVFTATNNGGSNITNNDAGTENIASAAMTGGVQTDLVLTAVEAGVSQDVPVEVGEAIEFELEPPPSPVAPLINGDNDLLPILGTEFAICAFIMRSGNIPSFTGDIITPCSYQGEKIIVKSRILKVQIRRRDAV